MAFEKLKARIMKMILEKGVLDLKRILKIDAKNGMISILGQRMIVCSSFGFGNLHGGAEKIAGAAAPVIVRTYGESSGRRDALHWKSLDPSIKMETLTAVIPVIYPTIGWAKVIDLNLDLNKGRGTIVLKNCFEADAILKIYGKKDTAQCYFMTGYFKSLIHEMTGKDWQVSETKCEAKGDEYCEFTFEC